MREDLKKAVSGYKKKVLRMLDGLGLLDNADEASLEILWDTYEVYLMCKEDIAKNGIMQDGAHGRTPNPAVTVQLRCVTTMTSIFKEFGVSTRARKLITNGLESNEDAAIMQFLED